MPLGAVYVNVEDFNPRAARGKILQALREQDKQRQFREAELLLEQNRGTSHRDA